MVIYTIATGAAQAVTLRATFLSRQVRTTPRQPHRSIWDSRCGSNARADDAPLQTSSFPRSGHDDTHELKTPLTVLQGELEQALQNAEIGSGEQVLYSGLLEEVQRLKVITERLLILSMADAGQLSLARMPLNLSDAVNSAADDIEAAAPGLTVQRELGPDVTVNADIHLVRQAIHNLVTNAIKYNVDGGWIHLNVAKTVRTPTSVSQTRR
jgi:signal transduction histidine kinase